MRRTILASVLAAATLVAACSSEDTGDIGDRTTTGAEGGTGDGGGTGEAGSSSGDGGAKSDAAPVDAGPEETGEATYYDADGTGACGFPKSNDFMVAAMNGAQYSKAICGKCVEVTGPLGTVVVRIVDLCPGCKKGDLDLSQTAFQKIAKLSAGRVKITWHYVSCP
jgi:expansin (peptidoglycan-binding protein)